MNYQQITFLTNDTAQREMLIAQLELAGFEGFEEQEDRLIASVTEQDYHRMDVEELAAQHQLSFSEETIQQQNWNAIWEAGFEPVIVDSFCAVRASFHPPVAHTAHEIVITPKMSFGTGHHATTQLMIEGMREIGFDNCAVLDFGTGTGILGILAKKLGATSIIAIDNDEWSVTNAIENAGMNETEMTIAQASLEDIQASTYDVILANINRNILLQYMNTMSRQVVTGGTLLLSGILEEDEAAITEAANNEGLNNPVAKSMNGWMAIRFTKQ